MNQSDLTKGNIRTTLFKLGIPLVATSFLQMAYNMVDMFWIGKLSSDALAAVGTAGFYLWLSESVMLLARTGTGVLVAQKMGQRNENEARIYAQNGIVMSAIFGILYALIMFIFARPLIGIFGLTEENVINDAVLYLRIFSPALVLFFINNTFSSILSAKGNTKTPFKINTIGLLTNLMLDPLLIFYFKLGVAGAALATAISAFVVFCLYLYLHFSAHGYFENFRLLSKLNPNVVKNIFFLGLPPALYGSFFTIMSIFVARMVANFGSDAIAAQKIGTMLESMSWMTAGGLSYALSSFIGQNFGAKSYDRVEKGFYEALKISIILGIFNTTVLYFGASALVTAFAGNNPNVVSIGTDYLKILAVSQIFMCIEITSSGAFNGVGKTKPPAVISMFFNFLRLPFAAYLSSPARYGIKGIWYAITISSIFKGTILTILYIVYLKSNPNNKMEEEHMEKVEEHSV